MQSWPTILPAPAISFSGATESSVIRTQMDSGRYRQRSRFTREQRIYKVIWEMDDFEYGMFQSWFLHKLNNGADSFEIDLPTGGVGLKTVVARFIEGKYSGSHKPVLNWTVTASLEVEDAAVFSEDEYDTLYDIGSISELEAAYAALHGYIDP